MSMSLSQCLNRLMGGLSVALLAALVAGGAGCASSNPNASSYQFPGENGAETAKVAGTTAPGTASPIAPGAGSPLVGSGVSSMLRVGDMLTVAFSDVPPPGLLEVKTRISDNGMITLHHNVQVSAAGRTIPELEGVIRAEYVPRLYRNLTAIVRAEDRFFYIGGEVKLPNRYPLQGDMTVLRAIETAGGFTDFAARGRIELRRQDGRLYKLSEKKIKVNPALDLPVLANDHIVVRRRVF
jgi:polysaccharide export outer membrane protein